MEVGSLLQSICFWETSHVRFHSTIRYVFIYLCVSSFYFSFPYFHPMYCRYLDILALFISVSRLWMVSLMLWEESTAFASSCMTLPCPLPVHNIIRTHTHIYIYTYTYTYIHTQTTFVFTDFRFLIWVQRNYPRNYRGLVQNFPSFFLLFFFFLFSVPFFIYPHLSTYVDVCRNVAQDTASQCHLHSRLLYRQGSSRGQWWVLSIISEPFLYIYLLVGDILLFHF